MWIKNGKRRRQHSPRQMMIRDNNIHCSLHFLNRNEGGYTTVYGNKERTPICMDCLHGRQIQSIPFRKSIWNIVGNISAQYSKIFSQKCRRCHSVNIIISIDYNFFAMFDSILDAGNSSLHPLHSKRIIKRALLRVQKLLCLQMRANTTMPKNLSNERSDAYFPCKRICFRGVFMKHPLFQHGQPPLRQ